MDTQVNAQLELNAAKVSHFLCFVQFPDYVFRLLHHMFESTVFVFSP
jgi:hypothetical protein